MSSCEYKMFFKRLETTLLFFFFSQNFTLPKEPVTDKGARLLVHYPMFQGFRDNQDSSQCELRLNLCTVEVGCRKGTKLNSSILWSQSRKEELELAYRACV